MDRPTALAVLGVDEGTPAGAIRARYLALVRAFHPDVAAHRPPADATVDVALVTEAYRVLRVPTIEPDRPRVEVDGDTLVLGVPPDEAFFVVVDALSRVGYVSYVDPDNGLAETIVDVSSGVTCSIVVSLQGRATGSTDAFCTIVPLGQGDAPPIERVVEELAEVLNSH